MKDNNQPPTPSSPQGSDSENSGSNASYGRGEHLPIVIMRPQFPLGNIGITPGAVTALEARDILLSLHRHAWCDWGDVCPEDAAENELARDKYLRIFSVYYSENGTKFWIITEADRSLTTVLLPDEY